MLRVTLKIQIKTNNREIDDGAGKASGIVLRHNLDLHNDTQVEKLNRKTATKLEIGSSVVEASLHELTELLEEFRIHELEKRDQSPKAKQLTEAERNEAIQLLMTKDLIPKTNQLIEQSGIIGEKVSLGSFILEVTNQPKNA